MPELLRELGIRYDPDRLAQVLKSRGGEVRARAIQVTATLGAFTARILKVQSLLAIACIALRLGRTFFASAAPSANALLVHGNACAYDKCRTVLTPS